MNSTDVTARLSPTYWRLWTASTISNLGDGVFLVALPLLASRLTRSELSVSFIAAAAALPWLALSLPIGAIVDRADRRSLMLRADAFRAALVTALTIVVATGSIEIWMLWIAAASLGVAEVFFDTASIAIVPSVVPDRLLERASSRTQIGQLVANNFVGTPVGGVLLAAAVWLPFGVNAASFVIAAALVLSIGSLTGGRPHARIARRPLRGDVAEGFGWLMHHTALRGLAIACSLFVLGMEMIAAIFVLFAQDFLHLSDRWYGALFAIGAVGAVAGSLAAERLKHWFGVAEVLYGAVAVITASMLIEGLWPRLWVSVLATLAMAFAATAWNTTAIPLRQRVVPSHLLGRVDSVYRWLVRGAMAVGAVLGGVAAHLFGLRAPFFIAAAIGALAFVTLFFSISAQSLAAHQAGTAPPGDDTPSAVDLDPW